jgi:hypothetical protein
MRFAKTGRKGPGWEAYVRELLSAKKGSREIGWLSVCRTHAAATEPMKKH